MHYRKVRLPLIALSGDHSVHTTSQTLHFFRAARFATLERLGTGIKSQNHRFILRLSKVLGTSWTNPTLRIYVKAGTCFFTTKSCHVPETKPTPGFGFLVFDLL